MKKMFSIIIPCYNVEKYVVDCVESVLNQTEKDFEIIIVNDGSTDKTLQIITDKYSKLESVKIIDQKNGGLSDARNTGIKNSNGEYLCFVDSDDYWNDEKALEKIKKYIIENNVDVVVIGNTKFFENSEKQISKKKINYLNQGIEYLLETNYFKACAWDKVVKKSLIVDSNNYFPDDLFSEDIIWCGKLLEKTNNIGCLEENFYMYRQRNGSITKSVKEKNILDMIKMIKSFDNSDNKIVKSFLAYEYSVALGLVSTKNVKYKISNETLNELFSLKKILVNDISKKVKKVRFLNNIVGIRITSKLLGIFIDIK